jgi:chromosome segregation ATPase
MERKEPTLSGGISNNGNNGNEREDSASRRPVPAYDEPRQSRAIGVPASSVSPLPAIALVIALLGVAGAGFLGWKLTEAQTALIKSDGRITQLENQLNITSTDSAASLGSLQVNIKSVDSDVKNLKEQVRKNTAEQTEKFTGVVRNIDASKKEIVEIKNDTNTLKQDTLAHKAGLEELTGRLDAADKALAEQRKRVQDVAASVSSLQGQLKNVESLTSRVTAAEEAIDAIDDNRRIINRDLVAIKQQLGIKN